MYQKILTNPVKLLKSNSVCMNPLQIHCHPRVKTKFCKYVLIFLLFSTGVSCDSCSKGNFRGKRFKCLICYDYDLCATCYENGATTTRHTADHPMQCILTRTDFGKANTFYIDFIFIALNERISFLLHFFCQKKKTLHSSGLIFQVSIQEKKIFTIQRIASAIINFCCRSVFTS